MFDLTTALTAMLSVGGLTFTQRSIKYVRDERRKKVENARADEQAPIVGQSMMLGLVDQATMIQQRTIAALKEQVDQLELEVGTLRAENTRLRERDLAKTAQIKDLYETIGQLEEANRKRAP